MTKQTVFNRIVMLTCVVATYVLMSCIFMTGCASSGSNKALADGNYQANLTMEGGTGKAYINSPVEITVENSTAYATLVWSSKNYDYMIVQDEKYINETPGEYSTFKVALPNPLEDITVIGDTTAMSVPHEIEYKLHFELIE